MSGLGLSRWSSSWTLASWCDLRDDFRTFRIDRMDEIAVAKTTFEDRPGQGLQDFLAKVRAEWPEAAGRS